MNAEMHAELYLKIKTKIIKIKDMKTKFLNAGKKVVYRVYYPGNGTQLKHEDFEADNEADAKGAAENFKTAYENLVKVTDVKYRKK